MSRRGCATGWRMARAAGGGAGEFPVPWAAAARRTRSTGYSCTRCEYGWLPRT